MTELVAAFFTVHCSLSFLADVYGLFNPSNRSTSSVMRTTVFLAHLLLTVPRTGRRIDFHSSDEDFRLEVETSRYINVLVVLDEF